MTDSEIAAAIVTGQTAWVNLQRNLRAQLESFLVSRCDRTDGRSKTRAIEIASEVLSDCYAKDPPLVARWEQKAPLAAFLRTVAENRLRSWQSSCGGGRTESIAESGEMVKEGEARPRSPDADLDDSMVAALREAVAGVLRSHPQALVFLWLKALHGVDQRALAAAWGHHESSTSRLIKQAAESILGDALDKLGGGLHGFNRQDLVNVIARHPGLLKPKLDEEEQALAPDQQAILALVAEGRGDNVSRRSAVGVLTRNAAALEFFARLLRNGRTAGSESSADLARWRTRMDAHLARQASTLSPADLRSCVGETASTVMDMVLDRIGADAGTIWLLNGSERCLEAAINPREPELLGHRQPLVSGIVSLVVALEELVMVEDASDHHAHSPVVDLTTHRTTHRLIAVPFRFAGAVRGVITAVTFAPDSRPFPPDAPEALQSIAVVLGRLTDSALQDRSVG